MAVSIAVQRIVNTWRGNLSHNFPCRYHSERENITVKLHLQDIGKTILLCCYYCKHICACARFYITVTYESILFTHNCVQNLYYSKQTLSSGYALELGLSTAINSWHHAVTVTSSKPIAPCCYQSTYKVIHTENKSAYKILQLPKQDPQLPGK